ncbi:MULTISPECIES: hypothetical protein [unclassified Corallococcus]|uniref:hypothetical protein n=1 Tax=unclassified Corallococcus TaxID=2685029 RepID=UPI001A8BFA6A|nr:MULTISPECIES: hypothetical protein [unclassified Corallococcus]MBN9687302.1 hypothetical protein [Corallococcus sp. NCSPR001]WAS88872.1 hypothetical protein O0N60_18275 [Corallococcus sp. NCRR]
MSKHNTEAGLITSRDLPQLAEAGQVAAPEVGHSAQELRQAVQAALAEQWSLMGIIDTGKKAADLGKKAADALTDKGKKDEDKAIHDEGKARDEAHKKMNDDKAKNTEDRKKHGKEAAGLGVAAGAFSHALRDLRA